MKSATYLAVSVLFLALLLACSSDSEDEPTSAPSDESPTADATAEPTPGETAEPTDTPAPFSLAGTDVVAELRDTYKAGAQVPPAPDELPFQPDGSVVARWYQSDGQYVVHYDGLVLADIVPVCPGNSIKTDDGFQHITNSPASEGACEGAPTLASDPAGTKICDGEVLYLTEIPVELEGTLYGSVELYREDGAIIGLSSRAETTLGTAPEIDLRSCSPAVP